METHRSRSGVRSVKEFVLEILMIVIGVLIALGVEQVRGSLHERRLAQEARENFRREIDLEKRVLNDYLPKVADAHNGLEKIIDDPALRARAEVSLPGSLQWQFLPTEAWDTAVATQAFSYMDPGEVQRYALVHTVQTIFNSFGQKQHDLLMEVYSYSNRKDLTPDEIKMRNHDIRLVLSNLQSIDQISQQLLAGFDSVSPAH